MLPRMGAYSATTSAWQQSPGWLVRGAVGWNKPQSVSQGDVQHPVLAMGRPSFFPVCAAMYLGDSRILGAAKGSLGAG